MKIIFVLLLSCLSLSAATLYPVMTDSSSRLLPGGQTNFATLNGTNTWAGTNQFTASAFFPANRVYWRQLYATGNVFLSTVATNVSNATLTNNGGSHVGTQFIVANLPALLGSNSVVDIEFLAGNTNANASSLLGYFYIGSGTNFVYDFACVTASASRAPNNVPVFGGLSHTNQAVRNGITTLNPNLYSFDFADTSASWPVKIVLSTTTSHTNAWIQSFRILERVVVNE